jgi:hypothetical protein
MKEKIKNFYECKSCEADNSTKSANSLNKKWCPCPKNSCDAVIVGKVITTIKVIRNDK